jgi:hypothetical protein
MWTSRLRQWISRSRRNARPLTRRPRVQLRLESLEERALPAVLNVAAGNTAGLIAAIQTANADGQHDVIHLASGSTYDFTTSNNNVNGGNALPVITGSFTIEGNGATIERGSAVHFGVTGGLPAFRLADIASSANVTFDNLTLQGGLVTGMLAQGGGIFNDGGNLTLNGVSLGGNQELASNGANGAAGANGANATKAGYNGLDGAAGEAGGAGGAAQGGGLFSNGGQVTILNSTIAGNRIQGGHGGAGGAGGAGGNGGLAQGGGLYVSGASVQITGSTLSNNAVEGGIGGPGNSIDYHGSHNAGGSSRGGSARGGALPGAGGHGRNGGNGGNGGNAFGGGLYQIGGQLSIGSSSVTGNVAISGNGEYGGNGAAGGNGGNVNSPILAAAGSKGGDGGNGGSGGSGGLAQGGGLYLSSGLTAVLDSATFITGNTAANSTGGAPGQGAAGGAGATPGAPGVSGVQGTGQVGQYPDVFGSTEIVQTASPTTVTFSARPLAKLSAGSTFGTTIQVLDQNGNPLSGVSVTLGISSGTLGGTLTATTDSSGDAVFTNLSETAAGNYELTASVGGLSPVSSGVFTVTPAAATKLAFVTPPPSSITAGSKFSPVVQLVDQYGNAVDKSGVSVSLKLSSGTLAGTTTVSTNASGQAVFSNLTEHVAGNYTLNASAAGLGGTTGAFTVDPAAAAKVSFASQPSSTTAGKTLSPVSVKVTDAFGNAISGVQVSLAVSSGSLNGTLSATSNAQGLAVFSNLSKNTAGTFSLKASVSGLTAVSSSLFTVSPAAAAGLAFVKTPPASVTAGSTFSPVVQLVDQYGNAVKTAGVSVSVQVSSGALVGTVTMKTNSSGQAVFSNLAEDVAGSYTLAAAATGLSGATSSAFTVKPASAAKLTFVSQPPASVSSGSPFTAAVEVLDKYGNAVSGVSVSLGVSSGTLGGTLTAKSDALGQAVFSNLTDSVLGVHMLKASASGLSSVSSNSFTVVLA